MRLSRVNSYLAFFSFHFLSDARRELKVFVLVGETQVLRENDFGDVYHNGRCHWGQQRGHYDVRGQAHCGFLKTKKSICPLSLFFCFVLFF